VEEQKRLKQQQKTLYREDERRLEREFHTDLAAAYGMTNHPKEKTVYDLAWREGHDGGLRDVTRWYEELTDLVK
jgi:hypothetical protein